MSLFAKRILLIRIFLKLSFDIMIASITIRAVKIHFLAFLFVYLEKIMKTTENEKHKIHVLDLIKNKTTINSPLRRILITVLLLFCFDEKPLINIVVADDRICPTEFLFNPEYILE